jgi:hypothetical protein
MTGPGPGPSSTLSWRRPSRSPLGRRGEPEPCEPPRWPRPAMSGWTTC